MDLLLCDDIILEILQYIKHGGDFITFCCVVNGLYDKCIENKKLIEHITFYCGLLQRSFSNKVEHFDKIVLRRSEFCEVPRIKDKLEECISSKVDLKFAKNIKKLKIYFELLDVSF